MPVAVINHIGLTTPDIFGTIDWYCSVLGFELIMGPRVLDPLSHRRGTFRAAHGGELLVLHSRHFDVHVHAVQQRP